jgi:hypothetical protein
MRELFPRLITRLLDHDTSLSNILSLPWTSLIVLRPGLDIYINTVSSMGREGTQSLAEKLIDQFVLCALFVAASNLRGCGKSSVLN